MKAEITKKVNTVGKVGQILAKVADTLMWIALVVCFLLLLAGVLLPQEVLSVSLSHKAVIKVDVSEVPVFDELEKWGESDGSLELDGISYDIESVERNESQLEAVGESEVYILKTRDLIWTMAIAMISIISILVVLHYIEALCKNFRNCETPFTEEVVQGLKKLAIAMIPMIVLSNVGETTLEGLIAGNMDLVFGVDFMEVMLVIIVFLLAAIFRYGAMLQQESDDTI